jgi:hypothetical protein
MVQRFQRFFAKHFISGYVLIAWDCPCFLFDLHVLCVCVYMCMCCCFDIIQGAKTCGQLYIWFYC